MEQATRQETSRERRRRETGEALLDAAYASFCEHGYAGASLDAIAGRAGFTKGALYAHFSGKDAVFVAVSRRQVAELAAELRALVGTPDAAARLGDWLAAAMRERRDWFLANAEFSVACARNPEMARLDGGEYAEFAGNLSDVVGDPDAGQVLLALVNGLIIHAAVRPDFDLAAGLAKGVALVQGRRS